MDAAGKTLQKNDSTRTKKQRNFVSALKMNYSRRTSRATDV
jgi:hypothetical protein